MKRVGSSIRHTTEDREGTPEKLGSARLPQSKSKSSLRKNVSFHKYHRNPWSVKAEDSPTKLEITIFDEKP